MKSIPTTKQFLPATLLAVVLLTGCARHYVITLNSGARISSVGKPKLQNGSYIYKDSKGQQSSVFAGSVRQVAPASMSKSDKSQFMRSTSK